MPAADTLDPRDASKPALNVPDGEHPIPSDETVPDEQSALPDLISALIVLSAAGGSATLAVYTGLHYEEMPAFIGKNTMSPEVRSGMLRLLAIGAAPLPLLALAYLLWRRTAAGVRAVARWSRILSPLVLAFALPMLFSRDAFKSNEVLFVISATAFGLGLERLFRVSFREFRLLPGTERVQVEPKGRFRLQLERAVALLPILTTTLLAAFAVAYFSYYTVLNHYRLQTSSWDLGIFDNMMWNLMRGEWFKASPDLGREGSHIQYHATFVAYLFVPFYAIRQHADTLLVLQALLVGSGAIPLYLLTKARTRKPWLGVLLAFAYCFHAPLHGPVFYDFHFLTVSPFFVWWVLYFFETGRKAWLVVSWLVALSVREDVSACLSMAGLFLLVSRKRPWWAFWGGMLSAVYFVAMKFGIMPLHRASGDKQTFVWMFGDLVAEGSKGYGGVLKTLATNPLYVFDTVLDPEKLSYLLRMFGPVLLLPLRSPKTWILFLPAGIFTLLSSGYKPLYQTYFQYTSNWTPYVFFATAIVLHQIGNGREGRIRVQAAAAALFVSVALFSYHHGAIIGRENFRGGFRQVGFTYTEADKKKYTDLESLIDEIPKNASVAATETEAPHVSNREDCFTMRFGHDDADYMLLSIAEAKRGRTRTYFKRAVDSKRYGFVRRSGDFMLWKRGAPMDKNAEGLKLIGAEPRKPPQKK